MHEDQIEQIKESLREMMQILITRGRPIDNEIRRAIVKAIEHAAERITQLRSEQSAQLELEEAEEEQAEVSETLAPEETEPPLPPGTHPPLMAAPQESSNINAFWYDKDLKKLYLKFQDTFPSQNGPVYVYDGVPKSVFQIIRRGSVPPKTSGSNPWHTWKEGVTPSHGASVYRMIKQAGYPYQRLS